MSSAEIRSAVRELELVARRNLGARLAGNYLATVIGRGLEFHEARPYVAGDDWRQIDWKVTARMGEPFVRTWVEEREREIVVAIDVSPSMRTGWQRASKLEQAVEIAATLAVSAQSSGDAFGLLTFSDRAHQVLPPRRGRVWLHRCLSTLMETLDEESSAVVSDPRAAIHAIQAMRGRRFVVFLISDFIDHDVPEDLKYLSRRHDTSLIHVYDPLEYATSGPWRALGKAAENGGNAVSIRPGISGERSVLADHLAKEAARHRVAWTSISTNDPVSGSLATFFHRRRTTRG